MGLVDCCYIWCDGFFSWSVCYNLELVSASFIHAMLQPTLSFNNSAMDTLPDTSEATLRHAFPGVPGKECARDCIAGEANCASGRRYTWRRGTDSAVQKTEKHTEGHPIRSARHDYINGKAPKSS